MQEVAALRRRVETLAAREAELGELLSEREGALAAADAALEKRTSENRELGAALGKAQESERRRVEEEGLLRQRLELAEDKVKVGLSIRVWLPFDPHHVKKDREGSEEKSAAYEISARTIIPYVGAVCPVAEIDSISLFGLCVGPQKPQKASGPQAQSL